MKNLITITLTSILLLSFFSCKKENQSNSTNQYDSQRIKEITEIKSDNPDIIEYSKTVFYYEDSKLTKYVISEKQNDNTYLETEKHEFTYNGDYITQSYYRKIDEEVNPAGISGWGLSAILNLYFQNNLLTRLTDSESSIINNIYEYIDNNLLSFEEYDFVNGNFLIQKKGKSLIENNKLIEVKVSGYKSSDNGNWGITNKLTFSYSDNLLSNIIYYRTDNVADPLVIYLKEEYYYSNGTEISEINRFSYNESSSTFEESSSYTYTYDSNSYLIEKNYTPVGFGTTTHIYTYEEGQSNSELFYKLMPETDLIFRSGHLK